MSKEKITNIIRILPDYIANQIAAGEVVQRPESVVKELVENSLDAGADSIAVVVKGAGKQLIHIIDNGSGMGKDDLALSIKRHATSKIFKQEDLESIRSYGFRGEALASIAAVAGLEIRSKQDENDVGWSLKSDPMKEALVEPCSTDNGTQIFVKNLFYNVPARRKFLRANLTEFRYISDTMIKFALSRPNIRFTFYDNDTLIFDVKPSSLEDRIANILGVEIRDSLVGVNLENEAIKIHGFTGTPNNAKRTRSNQYFFLNNRSILSKSLSHAVYSAYDTVLEKNQYPFFLLNLEIDPENIDINVHPQKHEVKFDDDRFVYNSVNTAVMSALQKGNFIPVLGLEEQASKMPFIRTDDDYDVLVNKTTGEIIGKHQENFQGGGSSFVSSAQTSFKRDDSDRGFAPREKSSFKAIFGSEEEEELFSKQKVERYDNFIQLHGSYIMLETEKGGMLINQHAAHVRILFERAIKSMKEGGRGSQELLYPINIKLNVGEIVVLNEINEELINLGFDIAINDDFAQLLAVPVDIKSGMEELLLRNMIAIVDNNSIVENFSMKEKLALAYSQKVAIENNKKLSNSEIKNLVTELFRCSQPYSTPTGKSTLIEFQLDDLKKRFNKNN